MALPPGIQAKTVSLGIASFADGSLATGRATVSLNVNVLHVPSNRPIFSSDITKPFVDGIVTFDLLPTDAPGLNRVDWSYSLRVEIPGAKVQPEVLHFLLPAAGPDVVDLDGLVTVPSSAGVPISVDVVTSVNGMTGDVTVEGGSGSGVNAADTGYDVILLIGQSNMAGSNTDYNLRQDPPDSRVFSYDYGGTYGDRIAQAQDPLQHQSNSDGAGPGLSLGRWYARGVATSRAVLLVPAAAGGTPLVATATPTWNPNVRSSLYDNAITQAQDALAAAGANARLVGVVWVQGEADEGVTTAAYRTALDTLINGLRSVFSKPSLPFIIGGLVPENIAAHSGLQTIANVHADTPNRLTNIVYVPGPAGMDKGDGIHYTAAGQRIQGRRFAAALTGAPLPPLPTPTLINTVAPAITGTATTGNTLTVSNGTWSPTPDSYAYQWKRAGVSITGATSGTYTLVVADEGQAITCTVSATKSGYAVGAATSGPVTAAAGAPASADFGPPLTAGSRGTPTYVAGGKFGKALTGGALLADSTTLTAPQGTVEGWVRTTVTTGVQVAMGADGGQWIGVSGGFATWGRPFADPNVSTIAIADGQWHHVALVLDGSEGILYVDGVRANSNGAGALGFGGVFGVGGFGSNTQFDWTGAVDEVRVSKVRRYTAAFTAPAAAFTADADTLALYHLEA